RGMPSGEKEKTGRPEPHEATTLLADQTEDRRVEEQLEEAGIIKAPDGGYGWVIVAASFFANLCVDGVIFTVGTILGKLWRKKYDANETEVSMAFSLLAGAYLLVGPVASTFANTYGCRPITIVGALVAFFGFVMSAVSPNIYLVYLSFGLVGGVGFGLVYLPSLVIVSHYFDSKRALATGIAVCGSGIGTTIFAWLNPNVIELVNSMVDESSEEHVPSIFLCFTAIVALLCIIPGVLYKPLKLEKEQLEQVTKIVQEYEACASRKNSLLLPEDGLRQDGVARFDANRPFLSTLELNAQKKGQGQQMWSQRDLAVAVARESLAELNRPLSRADIFYPGSTAALNERARAHSAHSHHAVANAEVTGASNFCLSKIAIDAVDEYYDEEKTTWHANLIHTLRSMLDVSLLRRPSFIILALSGFLTLSCFYVPYLYLGNHIDRVGNYTDSEKSLPISVLGIVNIVARIGCGYIADRPQADALLVSSVALTLAGASTMAVPFFTAYWMFIAYCIPFAVGAACFAALRTVVCAELFGLEKLSSAFGVLLMFMGIGALVGSPAAALLSDLSGNFDLSFYVMGGLMALSGVILFPLRRLAVRENEKEALELAALDNKGL
ncbi:hypothetical protein PMAYCL1PPCAC_15463, partial [Pristionchus mayeri]